MKSRSELEERLNAFLEVKNYLMNENKEEVVDWLENVIEELKDILDERHLALKEEKGGIKNEQMSFQKLKRLVGTHNVLKLLGEED